MNDKINFDIIGDSHVRKYFSDEFLSIDTESRENTLNKLQSEFFFNTCSVQGATMYSINSPNSKTKANYWYSKFLKKTKQNRSNYFGIHIGEIDCNYTSWILAHKKNKKVKEIIDTSVQNLKQFILENVTKFYINKQIIIICPTLPSIHDSNKYFNKNGLVRPFYDIQVPDIKMRTELTLYLNAKLKILSDDVGSKFIDISNLIINNETQLIDEKYTFGKNVDNHLPFLSIYNLWLGKFRDLVK